MDRLPNKGSAQEDNAQPMGRPKYLNNRPEGRSNHRPEGLAEEERCLFSDSGPPLRPEGSLRSPARLRMASPTERPDQNTTSDSDPTSSTGDRRNPAHRSSPTGALRADWNHPTGDARSVGTKRRAEKGKARLTSQNHCTRDHTLHGTVLCSYPDTNSIVGADISLYSIVGATKTPIR